MSVPRRTDAIAIPRLLSRGAREIPMRSVQSVATGTTAPVGYEVEFDMELQQQTQWCWAAVSVSTSRFFLADSRWEQCRLVGFERDETGCCSDGTSPGCNHPHPLTAALTRTGNLLRVQARRPAVDEVLVELKAGRPVPVRIGWQPGGDGHYVVISAIAEIEGTYEVTVRDPWEGGQTIYAFSDFLRRYKLTGSATHYYQTRPGTQMPGPMRARSVSSGDGREA